VRAGAVPGLHALAAAGSLGVLNTWGAKGVFDWRSRHHLATAGLQALDFELAGLGTADLIVATGVDPAEAGGDRWRLAPAVEVAPGALDPLSGRWDRPLSDIAVPPLRTGLARVTQEGWASTSTPLAPSLVTRHYSQVLGAGGLVAADPGTAGYWVARTYATTELGGVQVPAPAGHAGFAVACATVARLRTPARPVLAVVDGPVTAAVHEALDAAASLGVAVPVEAWHADGDRVTGDDHLARLQAIVHADRPPPVELATDPGQLGFMVDVAGEIIAWTR
jgi:thiamine pyrophosphate-dependent acetolactate synthase large subunit-like protein